MKIKENKFKKKIHSNITQVFKNLRLDDSNKNS